MRKTTVITVVSAIAWCAAAAPSIKDGSVEWVQNSANRVTIDYELEGEAAIVTLDVCTNGVSIGGENIQNLSGDVNRKVAAGRRRIFWSPVKSWPNHRVTDGSVTMVVSAWSLTNPPDYLVADLVVSNSLSFYATSNSVPGGVLADRYKEDKLLMRRIPAENVRFRMGSPSSEEGRQGTLEVPHYVVLTNDYYIGVFPVTQRQYELLWGGNPSKYQSVENAKWCPVEQARYNYLRSETQMWPGDGHAVASWSWFGKLRGVTGLDSWDLPTSAEWEYACRAGSGGARYSDADVSLMAWYSGNVGGDNAPRPVGQLMPNAWGLYDMLGNRYEWCLDWLAEGAAYSDGSEVTAPVGPVSGTKRVSRGGCSEDPASACRCASTYKWGTPTSSTIHQIGFRATCLADFRD